MSLSKPEVIIHKSYGSEELFLQKRKKKLLVKVCGMRDEANIRAILEHSPKPDFLGFIFYEKSPRFVGTSLHPDFMRSLAESVKTVGVFVNEQNLEAIFDNVQRHRLSAVQLHGAETPDYCLRLRESLRQKPETANVGIWKAFPIATEQDLKAVSDYEGVINHAIFDTKGPSLGGNGVRFDWSVLHSYQAKIPFFLSGGISPENADEIKALEFSLLQGVDINSKFETAPAQKDTALIGHFLRSVISL